MKKLIIITIALATAFTLSSCDSGGGSASGRGGADLSPDTPPAEDTLTLEASGNEVDALTDFQADEQASNGEEFVTNENGETISVNDLEDTSGQLPEEDILEDAALEADQTVADSAASDSDVVADQDSSDTTNSATSDSDVAAGQDSSDAADSAASDSDVAAGQDSSDAADSAASDSDVAAGQDSSDEADSTTSDSDVAADNNTPENIIDAIANISEDETNEALSTIELDINTENGRWYQVEQGVLPIAESASYEENLQMLNVYREKLIALRTEINNTYDEDTLEQLKETRTEYLEKISEIREVIGYGVVEKGIYTAWANQKIEVKADNVEKAGWYRLRIVAKNVFGELPNDYEYFNINVVNANTNEALGGIQIKASTDTYQRGSMLVYLEEGENNLAAYWTNDAYKAGEYDANIQIKRISLGYAKFANELYATGFRTANQYSSVEGRFFWDADSVYTNWANQTLGFRFSNLESGKYRVVIVAKNHGSLGLPKSYTHFKVDVSSSEGTSTEIKIPASDKKYKKGQSNINLTGSETMIYVTWLNDSWKPNVHDANIQIQSVKLERIGDSDHSALAAYLMGTTTGHKILMLIAVMLTASVIMGISIYNKKRISN